MYNIFNNIYKINWQLFRSSSICIVLQLQKWKWVWHPWDFALNLPLTQNFHEDINK